MREELPRQRWRFQPSQFVLISAMQSSRQHSMNKNLMHYYIQIWDLSTRQMVRQLPRNVSNMADGFGEFYSGRESDCLDRFLQGQQCCCNISRSMARRRIMMTDPTHETQTAFAWSPSGSKLGVLQLRRSSDVVLITDLGNKQAH